MEIYSLGKHDLCDYELDYLEKDKYTWLVYWYENGGYDGSGHAVALRKEDNMLYCRDLGHCSCYGPTDCWETSCSKMTIEEFLRDKDSIFDYNGQDDVNKKVRELLG